MNRKRRRCRNRNLRYKKARLKAGFFESYLSSSKALIQLRGKKSIRFRVLKWNNSFTNKVIDALRLALTLERIRYVLGGCYRFMLDLWDLL